MNTSVADCIFCKIVQGSIPSEKVYEDERFLCFRDTMPQAMLHFLVIPKEHVVSLETAFPESGPSRAELLGQLFEAATKVARKEGLLPKGFRTVINTNKDGGQTVDHVHVHVLGGEPLSGSFA